jgi:hypothetical protein
MPQKIQFRLKRRNQIWHVFSYIGYNFKSELYFYTGAGGTGRLTQADYVEILEDNDNSHGTRGNTDNKCKQAKRRLNVSLILQSRQISTQLRRSGGQSNRG